MFRESLKISWGNIVHNKMRSFLTVLGIVIGVASIIALITIVSGATASVTSQITALGANKITVQAFGTPLKQGLNEQDLSRLSAIPNVSGVSPTVSSNTAVAAGKTVDTDIDVEGKNEVYFRNNSGAVLKGRPIDYLDVQSGNQVALIGSRIEQDLFYGKQPINRKILINGVTYTVVGVLKNETGFRMGSTNDSVLIPYTSAMRTLGVRTIRSVDVYMSDTTKSDDVITNIKNVLNQAFNYHDDAFSVFNMQDMISTIGNITGMMSLLLAGIASISLLVGGIGIMNMMLVSVTERTTEIGLRKALGAEPSRIQLQFLIESIFLSLFGGVIGIALGLSAAFAASRMIGVPFAASFSAILLAFGFAALTGIVFGIAPARKASRLNPIDALRHV